MPDKRYLKTLGFNNGQPYYVPEKLSELTDDVGYALTEDIPTQVSELENDADYLVPEDIEGKANVSGKYDDIVSGSADQLLSDISTPNTSPYLYRPTPADSDRERVKRLEGLSVGWNQVINGDFTTGWSAAKGTLTASDGIGSYEVGEVGTSSYANAVNSATDTSITTGHKVLVCAKIKPAHTKNDVAFWFNKASSATGSNARSLSTFSVTEAQWNTCISMINVAASVGYLNVALNCQATNGYEVGDVDQIKEVMLIDLTTLFGSTIADYIYSLEQATSGSGVAWVKQYIDLDSYHAYSAPTIKSVEGLEAHVMRDADDNIIGNYPLDSTLTLRGIPKLVDGKLVADGDWYEPSGKQTVRYALDQMTYTYLSGLSSDYIGYVNNATYGNMIWVRNWNYSTAKTRQSGGIGAICNVFPVFMHDTDFTSSQNRTFFAVGSIDTVEAFLTYVQNLENNGNGLFIVYELATPTTSTALPYSEVQICESGGTEEFVTDSVVPVGNVTEYMFDIRGQVEKLKAPTTDGTYKYQCTVVNGKPTYAWVSES